MALAHDPQPTCLRCGKPILRRRTLTRVDGQPMHLGCLVAETGQRSRETQHRAGKVQAEAGATVDRARQHVERSGARRRNCPVCDRNLMNGQGVMFQGDTLVHAACWNARPDASPAA